MKSEVERRTKSLHQKFGRPVGSQKGHEGAARKMVANPDEIEIAQSQYCQSCGRDLAELELTGAPEKFDPSKLEGEDLGANAAAE